ncbi:MAG: NADH-quinone oxidoreductase subunit C [Alistipes indistinctus]|jgi:Ni,Fe-hydrogenase III large subunit|uniref:hydrogenase large subunit n=1 Tax=Alistipes indistinctus TaxID=626932 RepID=UPI0026DACB27|nr:NADH-quinone oxidoreductase subunit C [Alistipes indistinctus]
MKKWFMTSNRQGSVKLDAIPCFPYPEFLRGMHGYLRNEPCHLAAYFGMPSEEGLRLFCLVLDDASGKILIASSRLDPNDTLPLPSLTALYPAAHPFERELTEQYGICFADHPWNKPLRFAHDRADRSRTLNNYPFYAIRGQALHEVNVGPIHAGIIEPGCFRFICNGEQVIHLEIVLGFQHRGIERLICGTPNRLRQSVLSESIAGDSVVAHALAYAEVAEGLGEPGLEFDPAANDLGIERTVALEMERIAMHLADTGALCMDIGYQLGQVACEALRTIVINTTQRWCGNRFAKGLIRFGGTHYPLTDDLKMLVLKNLNEVETRYAEVVHSLEGTSSVLARFEDCGVVTRTQALRIGAVGMAARASGLVRDIRQTHPRGAYGKLIAHDPVAENSGDVYARLRVRMREVAQSAGYVRTLLDTLDCGMRVASLPDYRMALESDALAFSLVEGWRGEVCHVGITGSDGQFRQYKIYDPSLHNWTALALSVRGAGISDFPICNKSFNLSYCGHDL